MFTLFFNLYLAMFRGIWNNMGLSDIKQMLTDNFNVIGRLITSIFNNVDTPLNDLGDILQGFSTIMGTQYPNWMGLVAFVLALITSIGIVVMAVKGIKRAFSVFFMLYR